jgi:hypothetical protein
MRIPELLADLVDVPEERLVVALADAVFFLDDSESSNAEGSRRFQRCLSEADMIRRRLEAHGFKIVDIDAAVIRTDKQDRSEKRGDPDRGGAAGALLHATLGSVPINWIETGKLDSTAF